MGANTLTLAIAKAGDTASEAGKAFADLGVTTQGKSYDQVFEDTAAALGNMENETRRNEIANTLYGRSWKEMLPFIEEYIKNKEKIQKTPTFSKQDLQDLKDAKAAWDDLGNSVTIYSGKALVDVQKGTDLLLKMDSAYRKLGVGDVSGFLADAGAYRNSQVEAEAQKLKDLIATNSGPQKAGSPAGAPVSDPFAGLTAHDAEIKFMTDYTIPDLEKAYNSLATSGTASMTEIADASLKVVEAKQKLITLTTEETDTQKELKSATDDLTNAKTKLADIEKDYARQMSVLNPRDVAGARSMIIKNKWAVEDQQGVISAAQAKVGAAAAGGQTFGDVIVNVDGKTIARIPGVAAGTGERSLTQAGF
jgi:hypothetical protein